VTDGHKAGKFMKYK